MILHVLFSVKLGELKNGYRTIVCKFAPPVVNDDVMVAVVLSHRSRPLPFAGPNSFTVALLCSHHCRPLLLAVAGVVPLTRPRSSQLVDEQRHASPPKRQLRPLPSLLVAAAGAPASEKGIHCSYPCAPPNLLCLSRGLRTGMGVQCC